MQPSKVTATEDNVHVYRYEMNELKPFRQFLFSDAHIDNPDTDLKLLRRYLDFCLSEGIVCHHFGDLFDAMQGKQDRRSSKSKVREELKSSDYLNSLVDYMVNFFKPYASILGVFTYGNHETSIISRFEFDLLKEFVYKLRVEHNSPIQLGGYSGYIVNQCYLHRNNPRQLQGTIKMAYRHSGGSRGEVSKGVLGVNRMQNVWADADIIISGDNHEKWVVHTQSVYLNRYNRINQREIKHIKLPTLKDEFGNGKGGWHVETDKSPRSVGGCMLTFEPINANNSSIIFDIHDRMYSRNSMPS